MATSNQIREQIEVFARKLSEKMGKVDESMGVCWLDAIEITDALHAELLKQRANDYPAQDDESACPQCGEQGQYKGTRQRKLLTRRGPAA